MPNACKREHQQQQEEKKFGINLREKNHLAVL